MGIFSIILELACGDLAHAHRSLCFSEDEKLSCHLFSIIWRLLGILKLKKLKSISPFWMCACHSSQQDTKLAWYIRLFSRSPESDILYCLSCKAVMRSV